MSGDITTVDSDMSTSVNSDASLDIDIVRHHDGLGTFRPTVCNPTFPVATSTANLLDTRDFDTETDSEEDLSQFGRAKIVNIWKYFINIWKYFVFSPTEWELEVLRLDLALETMACTPGWECPGWSCISCLSCSSSTRGNPLASPWCASDSDGDGDGLVMNLINISNTNHTFYWLWPLRAFIANVCLLRHQHGYMIFQQSFPSDHIILHQQ